MSSIQQPIQLKLAKSLSKFEWRICSKSNLLVITRNWSRLVHFDVLNSIQFESVQSEHSEQKCHQIGYNYQICQPKFNLILKRVGNKKFQIILSSTVQWVEFNTSYSNSITRKYLQNNKISFCHFETSAFFQLKQSSMFIITYQWSHNPSWLLCKIIFSQKQQKTQPIFLTFLKEWSKIKNYDCMWNSSSNGSRIYTYLSCLVNY